MNDNSRFMMVCHGGYWEHVEYTNGEITHILVTVNPPTTYADIMHKIHEVVEADMSEWGYKVEALIDYRDKLIRWKLSTDQDVAEFLSKYKNADLVVYVSLKKINSRGGKTTAYEYERMDREVVHPPPRGTHLPVYNAGSTSGEPTSHFEPHLARDEDNFSTDDEEPEPLHEQCYREYQNYSSFYPSPPSPATTPWCLPELPPSSIDQSTEQSTSDKLSTNSTFLTRNDMVEAVNLYHLENEVHYQVDRADKGRWCLKCKHSDCQFGFSSSCRHGLWRVVKLKIPHTCSNDPDAAAPKSLKSKFFGKLFAKKFGGSILKYTPKLIMDTMYKDYTVSVNYEFARQVKLNAVEMLYGDNVSSFSMLPGYLHQLKMANPGTYTALLTDEKDVFKYAFFALGSSITGFTCHGRPIIVIDGTHLKGKYCGVLFVAVSQDGNGQIFPLTLGIGGKECNESWTWFLNHLRRAYGCPPELVIVSDQHASIIHAMEIVYPEAAHGLCYYHLSQKLTKYGKHICTLFEQAAYTYHLSEFDRLYETLQLADQTGKLSRRLERSDPKRWARVKCPFRRFEFMTSNAAESFNKRLLFARMLPVVSMLESARLIMEKWFIIRRKAENGNNQVLCLEVGRKMAKTKRDASRLDVTHLGDHRYKVLLNPEYFIVDLCRRVCDCAEFQGMLMPCVHAAAAIRFSKYNISDFVDPRYYADRVKQMWGGKVEPVPHPNQWVNPESVNSKICLPPAQPKPAGRPPQKRRPSGPEASISHRKSHSFSSCHQQGHNRNNCTQPVGLSQQSTSTVNQLGPSTSRAARKCSICGQIGHTKRNCPNRVE